jgi:hypothetical protein|tara:strand:+ start:284 stop:454 length:171 start_codon:yes stop_codon:yes gene_type:complete
MDTILEKLEVLIDDIERDSQLTKDDIHEALVILKAEIEDYNLERGEGRTIEWEDLD